MTINISCASAAGSLQKCGQFVTLDPILGSWDRLDIPHFPLQNPLLPVVINMYICLFFSRFFYYIYIPQGNRVTMDVTVGNEMENTRKGANLICETTPLVNLMYCCGEYFCIPFVSSSFLSLSSCKTGGEYR